MMRSKRQACQKRMKSGSLSTKGKTMGKKTKITTFESTWNPVTGCYHNCPYCYAKRIAERFGGISLNDLYHGETWKNVGDAERPMYEVRKAQCKQTVNGESVAAPYPFGFLPTLHGYRLDEPQAWKTPKDIFVCSMADLFADYIPDEWIAKVFDACKQAPQHRYFFLTKNPERYVKLFNLGLIPEGHDNFWFGTTVTSSEQFFFFRESTNCFLSIEPIMGYFPVFNIEPQKGKKLTDMEQKLKDAGYNLKNLGIRWIIVGAETGNRKGRVIPEREWIDNIRESCDKYGIALYMKDSLRELMGEGFRQEKI